MLVFGREIAWEKSQSSKFKKVGRRHFLGFHGGWWDLNCCSCLEPWRSYSCVATIPETIIAPARKTSQKETSLPTHPFSGAMFVSGEGKPKMGLADCYKSDRRAQWRNPYSSKLTYFAPEKEGQLSQTGSQCFQPPLFQGHNFSFERDANHYIPENEHFELEIHQFFYNGKSFEPNLHVWVPCSFSGVYSKPYGCFLKWWYPHFTPQNDYFNSAGKPHGNCWGNSPF